MSFKSQDGKKTSMNRQIVRRYDDVQANRAKEGQDKVKVGGSKEAEGNDVSDQDIHEVVENHGPADKVEVEHDHAGGHHKVVSHHGDVKHESDHATAEDAHDHAKVCAGCDSDMNDEDDDETDMSHSADDSADMIPGL